MKNWNLFFGCGMLLVGIGIGAVDAQTIAGFFIHLGFALYGFYLVNKWLNENNC